MKEIQKYQCEICNYTFPTKDMAALCEQHHVRMMKIDKIVYKSFLETDGGKYPVMIQVYMEDGNTINYTMENPRLQKMESPKLQRNR